MKRIERILFARTDRMGDVLMNLPALRALRLSYPKAWIALLLDKNVAGLFRGHPDLDELIVVDAAELKQNGAKRRQLLRDLRKARFDLGIVSNPSKFFHWALFSCGIPLRAGWRRKWAFLLNRSLPDRKNNGAWHEIDANLGLVGLVAKEKWDGKIVMAEDKKSDEKITELIQPLGHALPIVVVHAGSSHPKKRWPVERFAELCRRLESTRACGLVLLGGAEEAGVSQKITASLKGPVVDLTGRLKLEELSAFFRLPQARVLVSSDSGPVHVAWMNGKPVVAMYAKDLPGSDPVRWGPRDGKSEIIFKPMNEITVDEVWSRVQRFL